MAFDGGPPLHKDAITAATERADRIERLKLDAEASERLADNTIQADKITRFPTYALEPYQYQRAASFEYAHKILGPEALVEDVIRAAAFIESGKLPDG